MATNDYCNYELSLALKECGFDEPCDSYYDKACASDDEYWHTKRGEAYNWNGLDSDCQISAPTLAHAQKWLREKNKIDVLVYNCACGYLWEVSKATNGTGLILFDEKGDDENSGCWTSYEAALSAGIAAAMELIKKGE